MTATANAILDPTVRPAWWQYAACASSNPSLFFVDQGESVDAAKRVCKDCPVRAVCLDEAIARNELFGIWGGMVRRERLAEARRRGVHRKYDTTVRCGTDEGFHRHIRWKEGACGPCREAHAARCGRPPLTVVVDAEVGT